MTCSIVAGVIASRSLIECLLRCSILGGGSCNPRPLCCQLVVRASLNDGVRRRQDGGLAPRPSRHTDRSLELALEGFHGGAIIVDVLRRPAREVIEPSRSFLSATLLVLNRLVLIRASCSFERIHGVVVRLRIAVVL